MTGRIQSFLRDDSGSTAIEYGLIAAILSITIIASLKSMRAELQSTFTKVQIELQTATN
jgi:pilus assembly protein Flp/PilA